MKLCRKQSRRRVVSQLKNFDASFLLLLPFLCVLKGYSTLREGIGVLKVKHLRPKLLR
jgi:hypothetical protein